ncbi:MAG: ATP-binding cassette domain-containing protein [Candidatus Caldarchaeum sp.]
MDSIVVENLVKKFGGVTAVDDVSFSVGEGELFGFLGPNGAGKTTTINILTTLVKPTSGKAIVAGYDVATQANQVRKHVGLVPQELTVDDDLTGLENLMLQAGLYHIPASEARKRAKELLELVGLTEAANRKVETYSGGMRKRLDLASGLLHHPEILFLDEPTLGLDVATRAVIWDYIRKLQKETGTTVFMTTHYMDEADALCQRIAIIDRGKIKAVDSPERLKSMIGGDIIELELLENGVDAGKILAEIEGVGRHSFSDGVHRLTVEGGDRVLPLILEELMRHGVRVKKVSMSKPSLEEVFLEFTGRKLRDEAGSWEEAFRRRVVLRRARS